MWGAVFAILEHSGSHTLNELDDGKIYRKALYVMVKSMVSCKFSLKPIHWYTVAMYRSCWASHLLQAVQRFRGYPATESHARHSGWSQEPGYIHRDRWTWFVWKNLVARKIDGWSVDHCFSTFSHGFPIVFPCFPIVFTWFPMVSRCSPIFRHRSCLEIWGNGTSFSFSRTLIPTLEGNRHLEDLVKELKPLKEFDPHVD